MHSAKHNLYQYVYNNTLKKTNSKQELSSCWDGRLFGHNRHGPKSGKGPLWGAGSPLDPI